MIKDWVNNKKIISGGGLLVIVVLLLALNMLANVLLKSVRIDLTDNQLYTLSEGSKNIVKKLEEPMTLRFYFSEKLANRLPGLANYARRVRELLEEYAVASKGNLKLIVADPEPFSTIEDQAVQYGLQGVPIDTAGSIAYFGLVGTNSTDDEEVIPFFQNDKEESLEYDITRLIYKLTNPKRLVVGLMSSLPMQAAPTNAFQRRGPQQPQDWMVVNMLKQTFDVRTIDINSIEIQDDIDILMVVHPKEISDKTLFALDQYVLSGGRAIFFVDPYAETDVPGHDPQNPMAAMSASRASSLKKLFSTWGLEIEEEKIIGDRQNAARVTINSGSRPQSIDYVVWLTLRKSNMSSDDFITSQLAEVNMATAGSIFKKEDASIEVSPLLESSEQAMKVSVSSIQFGPNPAALLNQYSSGGKKLTLAARVSGQVKTSFADGPPTYADGEKFGKATLMESKEPINVIVVADTDILVDKFWVDVQNFFGQRIAVPRTNNGDFLMNAIDNLGGSNDLISLRSRGKFSRPFDKVNEIQREAEQQFRDKEKELRAKLSATEQKINTLQKKKNNSNALLLSPEQKREIDKFQQEKINTRKELRNVQHELRKNIESLGSILKFLNIGLIPLIITLIVVSMGAYQYRQMRS